MGAAPQPVRGAAPRPPGVNQFLIDLLAGYVRRLTEQLSEMLYLPADKRVVRRLLALVPLYGEAIDIPVTQVDLASLANTSRATANQVLGRWRPSGAVGLRRGAVTVVDTERLAIAAVRRAVERRPMPSRRDLIKMTTEEVDAFLVDGKTMNVATHNHDGTIHLVAMWYGFVDGDPAFWTYGRSQKILNLERDPRITALVETGDRYEELRGRRVVGRGEVLRDRDEVMAVGASVYERYFGPLTEEAVPALEITGAKRLAVRIKVDRIVSWDHAKLGGGYCTG